jgi:hypothetical protein
MTLTQVVKAIFPHTTQTELFGELAAGGEEMTLHHAHKQGPHCSPFLFLSGCRQQSPGLG